MASVSQLKNGLRILQFWFADKRHTIQLGKASKPVAESFKARVEQIVAARNLGVAIDADTAAWLVKLPDDIHERIAATGLVEGRKRATLGAFIDQYVAGRTHLRSTSVRHLKAGRAFLVDFFGADADLRKITPADAARWFSWLSSSKPSKGDRERYAKSTVGRAVKRAREFFAAANDAGLIQGNPFRKLRASEETIESRRVYVPRELVARIIESTPAVRWKLVFALARYAGLRPGDMVGLKWGDVDFAGGTFTVSEETKTGFRRVPIEADLRAVLNIAWEQAKEGEPLILPGLEHENNLHTQALRVIAWSGCTPWPKLFVNMRASCESDWFRKHAFDQVVGWLGHSPRVALQHYRLVRLQDFDQFKAPVQRTENALPLALPQDLVNESSELNG